jgi:hypothetical protein
MSIALSLFSSIVALLFIIFNRKLAELVFKHMQLLPYEMASDIFGFFKSEKLRRAQILINRIGLVFAAIVLLLLAYVNIFGSISI